MRFSVENFRDDTRW